MAFKALQAAALAAGLVLGSIGAASAQTAAGSNNPGNLADPANGGSAASASSGGSADMSEGAQTKSKKSHKKTGSKSHKKRSKSM